MNRRNILLAAACLSLPTFLRANADRAFPLTRVKSGEGLFFWVEVIDRDNPEAGPLKLVQEVDTVQGWIDQYESDGKYMILTDDDKFKVLRTYGNYELRWRKPTEEEIARMQEFSSSGKDKFWNEEVSGSGIVIPDGCVCSDNSVAEANKMARLLIKEAVSPTPA